jgi:hypothetical protein
MYGGIMVRIVKITCNGKVGYGIQKTWFFGLFPRYLALTDIRANSNRITHFTRCTEDLFPYIWDVNLNYVKKILAQYQKRDPAIKISILNETDLEKAVSEESK